MGYRPMGNAWITQGLLRVYSGGPWVVRPWVTSGSADGIYSRPMGPSWVSPIVLECCPVGHPWTDD